MTNNQSGFLSPAIFFTFDAQSLGFNRNCILDTLQKDVIDIDNFQDFLIRNMEKKDNIIAANINSNFSNNLSNIYSNSRIEQVQPRAMGNAEVLEQQRREMEKILREEERQKKLKIEEENRIQREVII